jgi:hypothetical protein
MRRGANTFRSRPLVMMDLVQQQRRRSSAGHAARSAEAAHESRIRSRNVPAAAGEGWGLELRRIECSHDCGAGADALIMPGGRGFAGSHRGEIAAAA